MGTAPQTKDERDPLTERIIGCAIEVHRGLGPDLLEATYEAALDFNSRLLTAGVKRFVL